MTPEIAEILRAPFPPEQIGHLPKAGLQLDYVGHADVTSRLLEADPEWTWEPFATDAHGGPLLDTDAQDNPVGLWIKLTVGGVTRLGYGSCPSGQRDAVKVLIGDALRNAAMRFGVAVDLWAKGDRADPTQENATDSAGKAARRERATTPVTDREWVATFEADIDKATTVTELEALIAAAQRVYGEGRLTKADAAELKRLTDNRMTELTGVLV